MSHRLDDQDTVWEMFRMARKSPSKLESGTDASTSLAFESDSSIIADIACNKMNDVTGAETNRRPAPLFAHRGSYVDLTPIDTKLMGLE